MRDRGFDLAEALGLRATRVFEDGEEGSVYLLEDGRVLKITDSPTEAAIGLRLMELQDEGVSHPSVPRIDAVMWVEDVDNEPETDGSRETYYAVIREDFADVSYVEIDEHEWRRDLYRFHSAWKTGRREAILRALPEHEPCRSPALELLEGLDWVAGHLGIRLRDVQASNVGVGGAGRVGLRDLGRADHPHGFLDRVKALDFPEAPRLEPARAPAPSW